MTEHPTTARLRALAALRYTSQEAAAETGYTVSFANSAARRHGFRWTRQFERTLEKVRVGVLEGKGPTQIGRETGLDRRHIIRLISQHGLADERRRVEEERRARQAREEAERRERQEAERLARWRAEWRARLEARRTPPPPPSDPVGMVLALIQRDGRLPREVTMRLRPETLGAAMAQLALRPGLAAGEGRG